MEGVAVISQLQDEVRRRIDDVTFRIDAPDSPSGSWWIDVQRDGRIASIEWRPEQGFGVSGPEGGYGEGADFIADSAAAAAEYVTQILQT